jgi:hypothetical protein
MTNSEPIGPLPPEAAGPERDAGLGAASDPAENRGWSLRRRLVTSLVLGAVAFGGTTAIGDGSPVEGAKTVIERVDEGYAPNVPVSRTGTELMIKANNGLLDYGKYPMAGLLGLYGGLYAMRRSKGLRASFDDILIYDKLTKSRVERRVMGGLLPTVIAFGAMSMSLAGNASVNANAPTRLVMGALGGDSNATFLAPHQNYIPFNHANISSDSFGILATDVQKAGGSMVPVIFQLGDLEAVGKNLKPSSAPITAIPAKQFEKAFGVHIAIPKEGECEEMQVAVGKQLGTKPGDTVLLEQKPAKVVAEVEMHAGLDRVLAIGPLEQLQNCIFKGEPYSGGVVLGLPGGPKKLQEIIDDYNMQPYRAGTMQELSDRYENFWTDSITPQMVLLAGLLTGLGTLSIAGFKGFSVLQRHRRLAADMAQQIEEEMLIRTEWLRSLQETVRATGWAVPGIILTSAITNSTQLGLNQAATIESLGAGVTMASTAVVIATALGSARRIRGIDPQAEIRNTL